MDLYKHPYEFVEISGFASSAKTPSDLANNPMMKVPVLQHGDDWVIESDHISSYIVQLCDPTDRYKVNSRAVFDMNTKAMINGVMDESVKVIVATRHGVPVKEYEYFNKSVRRVSHGLQWLEDNHSKLSSKHPTYKEFHLICCWDHLNYVNFVPNLTTLYPHLRDIVHEVSESLPVIKTTSPAVLSAKK